LTHSKKRDISGTSLKLGIRSTAKKRYSRKPKAWKTDPQMIIP
jgi:hypothetical protein